MVNLDRSKKAGLSKNASKLFDFIIKAEKQNDLVRCRRLISDYIIENCGIEDNNFEQVYRVIERLNKQNKNFETEINDSIAIVLYYDLIEGITSNNLKKAINAIRGYALIFKGDENTMHFYRVDSLEKKLYTIFEKKKTFGKIIVDPK